MQLKSNGIFTDIPLSSVSYISQASFTVYTVCELCGMGGVVTVVNWHEQYGVCDGV